MARVGITSTWSKIATTTAPTTIQNLGTLSILLVQSKTDVLPTGVTGFQIEPKDFITVDSSRFVYARTLSTAGTLEVQD